ncbi:MAG: TIGR02117 family protein [Planctomycetaceae bacterium]
MAALPLEKLSACRLTCRKRFRSLSIRLLRSVTGCLLFYLFVCLIGLIPCNNDFKSAEQGVEIFVTSNAVHAEVVLPLKNEVIDWQTHFPAGHFTRSGFSATHVGFGWGDRGFFLQTPEWVDLKLTTACNALFLPSSACLHVTMQSRPDRGSSIRSVRISELQYRDLVDAIREVIPANPAPIKNATYTGYDAFYEAAGTYHLFNTCNCWVGKMLKTAGVRVGHLMS